MSCPDKLYILKDHEIIITISATSGFVVSDISSLVITLKKNSTVWTSFSLADGEITIADSVITLIIKKTDITIAGIYNLIIDMTDNGGKDRGLTPCPSSLTFDKQ